MATEYKIRLYNPAGEQQYELTEFGSLAYTKAVNRPGVGRFSLSGKHASISDIGDKWQVEVWRRNKEQEVEWANDFEGLVRGKSQRGVSPGTFWGHCVGFASMLGWRVVAWPAGVAARSVFEGVEAETIMKTLVAYNAGSSATTGNGRLRAGAISGLSVAADGGNGNVLNFVCPGQNLLEVLQDLALIGGGDFDLVKTAAAAWEFRWYTGQRGNDRSADVIFAVGYDNMGDPAFEVDWSQERTVAIVAGQGEGAGREFAIRTGATYHATSNNIEMFVDARDVAGTDALNARGDRKLKERRARELFDFEVQQTAALAYGRDYFLGDLVTAVSAFNGSAAVRKIEAVTVTVDRGGEKIGVNLQDE